ncbi:hypothetical protein AVEN_223667-1 [Araneus ventricosus]|uniref:Uncharacterized protein n=1 Tax=Araneus ventricosus TaxID=182803 RepID=A0A4Y2Q6Q0_ARAVE|nr:hypothetical protein AVEN_249847-1 [Araneus ventricosus]GBN49870.1 hypothetical protein AVEN_257512-1 [Araneus ventricosus]GBN59818.1 hypothetical protein AVEN_167401-1 [Araneus ventricosus]GBN59929.1 hypothetical protein AVEN_223667-1 [Araneus ventricosus]
MRHPTRRELLPSGSRNTLLTLDTSIGHPESPEMNIIEDIRDALLHAVEKRSPPPRTPMDLLTVLQDSWCEKPPGCLQTLVETMSRRVAAVLRDRGALHDIRQVYQFFWLFSVHAVA